MKDKRDPLDKRIFQTVIEGTMVICDFPNGYLDADPQSYFETKRQ